MDMVLSSLTYEMCMVYLDDVIVFSETFEDHIDRLEQVVTRLKEAGLVKGSKLPLTTFRLFATGLHPKI